jgi:hypothetical protein
VLLNGILLVLIEEVGGSCEHDNERLLAERLLAFQIGFCTM